MKTVLFKLVFVSLISVFVTIDAFAESVNFSSSECVRRSGAAVSYDFDGAIYTTSTTSSAWVLCHVPHTDFDGFLHNGGIDSGWYQAIDRSNNDNMSCRFRGRSLNSNGTISRQYGAMGDTFGEGTQRQHVTLSGIGENYNSGYVLACELPPRTANGSTKLYTYRVNQ